MAANSQNNNKYLLPVFLTVDTSGSMSGIRIEQVKTAIEEIKAEIQGLGIDEDAVDVKFSLLSFGDSVKWEALDQSPSSLLPKLEVGGVTCMGEAFIKLEKRLREVENNCKSNYAGCKRAVLVLFTDGMPTDDYPLGLNKLKSNSLFSSGTRIVVTVGDELGYVFDDCLQGFAQGIQSVITVDECCECIVSSIYSNINMATDGGYAQSGDIDDDQFGSWEHSDNMSAQK